MTWNYGNKKITLDPSVLQVFEHYKQTGKRLEKGGILLGEVKKHEIIITRASIPTIFDRSQRFYFFRSKKSAQLFTDYEFINSQGRTIYLGEWHTHPERHPKPSAVDERMIARQFHKNEINEDFLLLVIVGLENNYIGVYKGSKLIQIV